MDFGFVKTAFSKSFKSVPSQVTSKVKTLDISSSLPNVDKSIGGTVTNMKDYFVGSDGVLSGAWEYAKDKVSGFEWPDFKSIFDFNNVFANVGDTFDLAGTGIDVGKIKGISGNVTNILTNAKSMSIDTLINMSDLNLPSVDSFKPSCGFSFDSFKIGNFSEKDIDKDIAKNKDSNTDILKDSDIEIYSKINTVMDDTNRTRVDVPKLDKSTAEKKIKFDDVKLDGLDGLEGLDISHYEDLLSDGTKDSTDNMDILKGMSNFPEMKMEGLDDPSSLQNMEMPDLDLEENQEALNVDYMKDNPFMNQMMNDNGKVGKDLAGLIDSHRFSIFGIDLSINDINAVITGAFPTTGVIKGITYKWLDESEGTSYNLGATHKKIGNYSKVTNIRLSDNKITDDFNTLIDLNVESNRYSKVTENSKYDINTIGDIVDIGNFKGHDLVEELKKIFN
ncbi:MAG TPA: hypothetical protein DCL29_05430 [Eubacterium sp.]|nr:hypothetical protein [Eubacterium sp.]